MIKDDQYFHQRHIFIEVENTLLIILSMVDSNQPHMDNLRFMVLIIDDNISMSMPEINNEDHLTTLTDLEDYEYE